MSAAVASAAASEGYKGRAPIIPFLPRDEAPVLRRPERRGAIAVDDVDVTDEEEPEEFRASLRAANFPPADDIHSKMVCRMCECVGCLKQLGTCFLYTFPSPTDP